MLEGWWVICTVMSYPRELFSHGPAWASPIGLLLTWVVPILVVVNVPANVMVRALHVDPVTILLTVGATVLFFLFSRQVFRWSLRFYRSASS
jgi:ABC-2 type transport system permease protein